MKRMIIISVALMFGIGSYGCSERDDNGHNGRSPISNKQKVAERLESIETRDPASNAYMNPNKYIQHNLNVADGHAGFDELLESLPPGSTTVDVIRVFEDGDYVFAHVDYEFFGPQAAFDIFRFENGLIVEHWDNLQVNTGVRNPSGRTMFDGETRLMDIRKTGENKAFAGQFVEDVLIGQNLDVMNVYFNGDNLIQHDPNIADGVQSFRVALAGMFAGGLAYNTTHKILGEGNFVLVISEGVRNGQIPNEPTSFYNLFRISDGNIVEYWNVTERIPPQSEWQNQNGKFNFPY